MQIEITKKNEMMLVYNVKVHKFAEFTNEWAGLEFISFAGWGSVDANEFSNFSSGFHIKLPRFEGIETV